jgi:hypothetical protein
LGTYTISIWTDPDTTDDHTPGGKFWIVVRTAAGAATPDGTRVGLSVRPQGGAGRPALRAIAPRQPSKPDQFYVAVELDHEGQWEVAASVDGPLGPAAVTASVEATYDLRPPFATTFLYLLPFVAVGLLWLKAMFRRKRRPRGQPAGAGTTSEPNDDSLRRAWARLRKE